LTRRAAHYRRGKMSIPEKTRREMEAGAQARARHANLGEIPKADIERWVGMADRVNALSQWQRLGYLWVEEFNSWDHASNRLVRHTTWHVAHGPEFEDRDAERAGISPSEMLVAQIALALVGQGKL
jgi:hypothetical protein